MTVPQPDPLDDVRKLMEEIALRVDQVQARLAALAGEAAPTPALSAKDLARVEAVGEVACRHWQLVEQHGSMTLGDSLSIRREMYGDNVRSTANLFGKKGSGALLYRTTPYGTKRHDAQEIKLTEEGERIASLWKQLHP